MRAIVCPPGWWWEQGERLLHVGVAAFTFTFTRASQRSLTPPPNEKETEGQRRPHGRDGQGLADLMGREGGEQRR